MSETYNLIFGGVCMIALRDIYENIMYQEQSFDPDSEKPLFLQPGMIYLILKT